PVGYTVKQSGPVFSAWGVIWTVAIGLGVLALVLAKLGLGPGPQAGDKIAELLKKTHSFTSVTCVYAGTTPNGHDGYSCDITAKEGSWTDCYYDATGYQAEPTDCAEIERR